MTRQLYVHVAMSGPLAGYFPRGVSWLRGRRGDGPGRGEVITT